jgi:3-oxoadipate enol-lactonase
MKTIAIAFWLILFSKTSALAQVNQAGNQVPVDSGYVTVENGKLYYQSAGQGLNIVLIHDGMVHHRIWDEQFQLLAKNYRVIRYDRRAYGKSSDPQAPWSDPGDLKQVFDQLKIDQAVVFGMSSGGGLSIDFALKYPERVSGLVLVGAVVGGLGYTSHMGTRGGHMIPAADRSDSRKLIRYMVMDDPYEIYRENTRAKEKVMELLKDYPAADRGGGIQPKPADRMALGFLGEINVPTLILVGEFDIPDVHAHAGAINAGIRNSTRKIIAKSGHLIPIEQPELFNAEILIFLKWYPDKRTNN